MTATQKIDGLTNSYYGYALFSAALRFWQNGIGVWSAITTAIGFCFSCLLIWFIGNRLRNKSSLTRGLLLIITAVGGVLTAVGTARMGWAAISDFSLTAAFYTGLGALAVYMNAKSFRVLTDASVKAYIAS